MNGGEKIRKGYVFILAVLFLAVSHLTVQNVGSPLALPAAYFIWMTISLLVFLSAEYTFKEWKFILPRTAVYLFLYVLLILQSVLFNPIIDSHSFIFETAGLVGGIIFFISLHQMGFKEEEKESILYVIFAAGVAEALIALFQYFNPNTSIFLIVAPASLKAYGNFQHQNLIASYLATSLVISFYILSGERLKSAGIWLKGFFFLAVLLMAFILFLTGSRAGAIEVCAGAAILLWSGMEGYRKKALYPAVWIIVMALGLGLSVAAEKYYYNRDAAVASVGRKLENTVESLTGESISDARVPVYLATIEMIKERPVTGHGAGNFGSRFMHYRAKLVKEHPEYSYEPTFTTHPHNEILYRTAESGLLGGAGLLMVGIVFTVCLVRLGRQRGGAYAAFLFPMAFDTQVAYTFYQSMPHFSAFIFLLYLPSCHFVKEFRIKPVRLLKTGAITAASALFVIVTYYLIITFNAYKDMAKYRDYLMRQKIINTKLLIPALDNLYLNQIGARLFMDAKLRAGLMEGDKKLLEEFLLFSKEERKVYPHSVLYEREARALFDLGRKKEAYAMLDEAWSLYPGRMSIAEMRKEFLREEAEKVMRNALPN